MRLAIEVRKKARPWERTWVRWIHGPDSHEFPEVGKLPRGVQVGTMHLELTPGLYQTGIGKAYKNPAAVRWFIVTTDDRRVDLTKDQARVCTRDPGRYAADPSQVPTAAPRVSRWASNAPVARVLEPIAPIVVVFPICDDEPDVDPDYYADCERMTARGV